jgi:hypothetical protein
VSKWLPFLVPTGVLSSGVFHCSSDVCFKMPEEGEIDGLSYWDIGERNMLEFYRNPVRYVPKIFKLFIEDRVLDLPYYHIYFWKCRGDRFWSCRHCNFWCEVHDQSMMEEHLVTRGMRVQ